MKTLWDNVEYFEDLEYLKRLEDLEYLGYLKHLEDLEYLGSLEIWNT